MTAVGAFLAEILEWLLGSLALWAAKPTTAVVAAPTASDLSKNAEVLTATKSFPGLALVLAVALALGGCFDARVVIARPAVPVYLAEDMEGVAVFVKMADGSLQRATANLFAGEIVTCDPDDFPIQRRAETQAIKLEPAKK